MKLRPTVASDSPVQAVPRVSVPARRWNWQRFGGKFLALSVAAHLLLLALAAYYVVERFSGKHKQTFTPSAKGANASTRALEHKVQVKQQRQAASAPPAARRVVTTALSAVSLPSMPMMPSMTASLSPVSISGMGAAGVAPGGFGAGGGGGGGGSGGGGAMSFFGVHSGGSGLTGTFYDLKQTQNKQPTNMTPGEYGTIVGQFAKGGFNAGILTRFFKGPKPLYATQIAIPEINADEGPAAFQLQGQVKPKMWLVHYKGQVMAPEDGTYHFAGVGDDILIVKMQNRVVLDACFYDINVLRPLDHYKLPPNFGNQGKGLMKGNAFTVRKGEFCPLEILIGEQPGGRMCAFLVIEKEGENYAKSNLGGPILPLFRMSDASASTNGLPPCQANGPVWRSIATSASDVVLSR